MKKRIYTGLLILVGLFTIAWVSGYEDIIPKANNAYYNGSSTNAFRESNTYDLNVKDDAAISKINFGTCTDTGDVTYTVTFSSTPELVTGTILSFIASTPNATGAADLIIGSTTYNLKSLHNATPAANYIESGSCVLVQFDGTYMQILSPDANP